MIPWAWLIAVFYGGVIVGVVLVSLLIAAKDEEPR